MLRSAAEIEQSFMANSHGANPLTLPATFGQTPYCRPNPCQEFKSCRMANENDVMRAISPVGFGMPDTGHSGFNAGSG
jgi:hypothetical protein